MDAVIRLLGPPAIEIGGAALSLRSRKSWAVLAFLLLGERPQSRSHIASLLFDGADDPLRALRWSLSEIRGVLGDVGRLGGDPLTLELAPHTAVDVHVMRRGSWRDAVALPGLGAELLEGMAFDGCPGFEAWLLSERRHLAAASESIMHEASLALLARGDFERAQSMAVRVVGMNPLAEDHQALLVRAYALGGDHEAADQQVRAYSALLERELGTVPGPAIGAALRSKRRSAGSDGADAVTVRAVLESGIAAVDAGATEAGVGSLRHAVALAEQAGQAPLLVDTKVALAEALIHSLRGEDEEGTTLLHEAITVAEAAGMALAAGRAMSTVGYVEFLRARYDRAEQWLSRALDTAPEDADLAARVYSYLGAVASDRADYPRAIGLLDEAVEMSTGQRSVRRRAYALAMRGRVGLLQGDDSAARASLDEAIEVARADRWLAFLPWPEAFRGELDVLAGDIESARVVLERAFAAACQLGDPCWEGASARGLALAADAEGDVDRAFEILTDARIRCNRFSDTYVWLDVYILDALAALAIRESHPAAGDWAREMSDRAERSAMRELSARAMLHRHDLGDRKLAGVAAWRAGEIDNPRLERLVKRLLVAESSGQESPGSAR